MSRWVVAVFFVATGCLAQQATISLPTPDAGDLVRQAVENQMKAVKDPSARFMFRGTKTTPRGSATKVYVQTKEATAGMVVAYDGKPLTPEQRQAELARIERFLKNPDELKKKHRQEQEDAERSLRVLRAIPDAFLFEYAGEQPSAPGVGRPGQSLTILKFRPNPDYEPPSRIEQALAGMEGTVLVDAKSKRLAAIEGTLVKDVAFGWGILGHLDKGGHILLQQQEVSNGYWAMSRMNLDFTGKVLLVKSLAVSTTDVFSEYKPVPPGLTFADAIELLKKEELVFAENLSSAKNGSR